MLVSNDTNEDNGIVPCDLSRVEISPTSTGIRELDVKRMV